MQTFQFTKSVSPAGRIILDNLPLGQRFKVTLEPLPEHRVDREPDKQEFLRLLNKLRREFQANSPLAKMSREEVLAHLRKVREEVADELYPHIA